VTLISSISVEGMEDSMSPQVPRPSNAKGADPSEREAFKELSR
jgi:hypothetical protein